MCKFRALFSLRVICWSLYIDKIHKNIIHLRNEGTLISFKKMKVFFFNFHLSMSNIGSRGK